MPLGNWEVGLDHLLGIIKLSFTALNSYIMSKRSEAGKINKSALSLNLANSDVSLSNSSIASIASEHSFDPKQSNLESKLSVPISMLNNYLTVTPHQQETPEKQRLLKECQDLLSAILQLPVPSDSLLVRKVTKVYSKHFHLFYKSPQHIWASFLAAFQSYSEKGEKYGNILRTILQAMCYQGSVITNVSWCYPLRIFSDVWSKRNFGKIILLLAALFVTVRVGLLLLEIIQPSIVYDHGCTLR